MKTGFLKPGMKVIYHGHLRDLPMTFYKRDEGSIKNRWYFRYEDGELTALTAYEVNKRISRAIQASRPTSRPSLPCVNGRSVRGGSL